MFWFRSRARFGSALALFALAFQLALSFGHVHLGQARSISGHGLVLSSIEASTRATAAANPASKNIPTLADDDCAICALIHLAGALVPADLPALPTPAAFARLRSATANEFGLSAATRVPFAARAPPCA